MTENLQLQFDCRLKKAIALIKSYNIEYQQLGIFGSYARGTFNGRSDIDICLVIQEKPSRDISGSLREDCELLGVDVVFVTPEYFHNNNSRFARKLRNDWRCLDEK